MPTDKNNKKKNKLTFGTTTYFNHITKTHKQLSIHVNGYMHYRLTKTYKQELILLLAKHHISCKSDCIEIARNKIMTKADQGFT